MSNTSQSVAKFECDRCLKLFVDATGLKRHINNIHLGVKLDCHICGSQFTTKGVLKRHINTVHLKLKPFQCDECDYSCGRNSDLKTHVDSVHKKIRFHCSFDGCDKSFAFKNALSQHLKLHEGQVNLCDQCGKTFTTQGYLNIHKKQVHSDSRPFQCSIDGCDKSFKLKYDLTKHLKQVHGPKQHQCLICLKSFSTNQHLQRHIASVHDEVRHQCNKCTKSYSQLGYLQQHIKKQHLQTTEIDSQKLLFQNCLWCIEKFPNFNQFKIHAKKTHPKLVAGLLNTSEEL